MEFLNQTPCNSSCTVEMLESNLMSIATGVDTDVPDAVAHVQSGIKHTGSEIPRLRVPAITVQRER
jgi:hypothetical protein